MRRFAFSENLGFFDQDLRISATKYEIWSEMGPYGSVGAHIKTGRSPMAQDHFQTPLEPKMAHTNLKKCQKNPG